MALDIVIKIEAPELVAALRDFAGAFGRAVPMASAQTPMSIASPTMAQQTPAPAAPTVSAPAPVAPPGAAQQAPLQIPMPPAAPPATQPPPVLPPAVPTNTPSYSIEDLARAATPLIDAGRRQELVDLLTACGVRALTELPKECYGDFATRLRLLGAKI